MYLSIYLFIEYYINAGQIVHMLDTFIYYCTYYLFIYLLLYNYITSVEFDQHLFKNRTTFSTMRRGIIENVLQSTLSYPNETSKECIQFL
jgi:hypothetical protein